MNGNLKHLVATFIAAGGASITWIEQANNYGKFVATIIAILAGIFTLWKHIDERFGKKNRD